MDKALNNKLKKESKLSKDKSVSLKATMIKKSLKKDLLNLEEVSELLKSVEEVKSKLEKLRIE